MTNGELLAELDPATYKARLTQAKADLASAKAQLTLAKMNSKRAADLLKNNLVTQSDYDTDRGGTGAAQAAVEKAVANVDSAQVDLDRTKIYSPIDGTVINRAVDVGQTVQSSFSAPTLFLIANDLAQNGNFRDGFRSGHWRRGRRTGSAHFMVDAFPTANFRGVVSRCAISRPRIKTSSLTQRSSGCAMMI